MAKLLATVSIITNSGTRAVAAAPKPPNWRGPTLPKGAPNCLEGPEVASIQKQSFAWRIALNGIFCAQILYIKSNLHYTRRITPKRGPSPRLSAWATQLRRNAATVASRWRHCADLTGPGIESQTYRTGSVRLATELTAGRFYIFQF